MLITFITLTVIIHHHTNTGLLFIDSSLWFNDISGLLDQTFSRIVLADLASILSFCYSLLSDRGHMNRMVLPWWPRQTGITLSRRTTNLQPGRLESLSRIGCRSLPWLPCCNRRRTSDHSLSIVGELFQEGRSISIEAARRDLLASLVASRILHFLCKPAGGALFTDALVAMCCPLSTVMEIMWKLGNTERFLK